MNIKWLKSDVIELQGETNRLLIFTRCNIGVMWSANECIIDYDHFTGKVESLSASS